MQRSDWDRLAAPFPRQAIDWRIVEIAEDGGSARVRAQVEQAALIERLDSVAGRQGWSLRLSGHSTGVFCQLEVAGVCKSAVADEVPLEGSESCARAAFALAAELFGMTAPAELEREQWVDYDRDERQALLPETGESVESFDIRVPLPAPESPSSGGIKPEGQQAIDRLVERLKAEGKGLEAARLLVEFGGYGSDPDSARELYRRLRQLLTTQSAGPG